MSKYQLLTDQSSYNRTTEQFILNKTEQNRLKK